MTNVFVQHSQNRNPKIVQSDERKNIVWIFPKVALLVNVVVNKAWLYKNRPKAIIKNGRLT